MTRELTGAGGGMEGGLSPTERLRLDYQQTTDFLRSLTDVQFKLLALVPTLSGTAVALLGRSSSAVQLLALGVLGLTATVGILLYELRNSQLTDYAIRRAQRIEAALGLRSIRDGGASGGLFSDRPERTLRIAGLAAVNRDRGLALVYSAALAGWTYVVAWGFLRAVHAGNARSIGAAIGAAVGLLVLVEVTRIHTLPGRTGGGSRQGPAEAEAFTGAG